MRGLPEQRKQHQAWQRRYDVRTPKVGDQMPGFSLAGVNGENPTRRGRDGRRCQQALRGCARGPVPDRDGRVAYAGGIGPFGYKPAELGEAIECTVSSQTAPQDCSGPLEPQRS